MSGARRLRVHWAGEFAGPGSLAQVNLELARRLQHHVTLTLSPWPIPGCAAPAPVDDPELAQLVRDGDAVDVTLCHGAPPRLDPPASGRWAWMQPWEYGSALPVDWAPVMRGRADAVVVYSSWVARQLVEAGVPPDRVHAVELGVDCQRFHPAAAPRDLATRKRIRLLYVGALTHRKGIDILLRAFGRAFTADDDVALVVKAFDPGGRYSRVGLGDVTGGFAEHDSPEVVLLDEHLDDDEMPGLYTACDAFVHPYRAEGFCLPIAEAMACGVPVITSDRGGPSGLASADTATLVPSFAVYMPVFRLGARRLSNLPHWHEPVEPDLVRELRGVLNPALRATLSARALRARRKIETAFTWDAAAGRLLDVLREVVLQPPREADRVPAGAGPSAADAVAEGVRQLGRGELDASAASYHQALGLAEAWRHRAEDNDIAAAALAGMGAIAGARGLIENAYRFHTLALRRRPSDTRLAHATAIWAARAGHEETARELFGAVTDGLIAPV